MYIALDIGGTKTLLAVFDDEGSVKESVKFATPADYKDFLPALEAASKELTYSGQYIGGAIGIRGLIDRQNGLMLSDSVLTWNDAPIVKDCMSLFACSFAVENDTKLAGLSEAAVLAGEFSKVLYITISTGIGSALVVDGTLELTVIDSELGKSLYEHEGVLQPWENYAGGKAIVEKYGKRASEIENLEIWKEISANLAPGIINASAVYTPDIIIFGGGVGSHFHKYEKPLRAAMEKLVHTSIRIPEMRKALRPEEAVIYGCYELATQRT